MKVSNQNPPAQLQTDKTRETQKKAEIGAPNELQDKKAGKELGGFGSTVEISDEARLMKTASEIAHREDPARQSKLNELKRQVREGSYKVDAASVAERLVEEHLLSHLGDNSL